MAKKKSSVQISAYKLQQAVKTQQSEAGRGGGAGGGRSRKAEAEAQQPPGVLVLDPLPSSPALVLRLGAEQAMKDGDHSTPHPFLHLSISIHEEVILEGRGEN